MNKERQVTGTLIVFFEKDTKASTLNQLCKDFEGEIVILHKLIMDEDLSLKSNLHVIEDIVAINLNYYDINIIGDFYCLGSVDCANVYVSGYCYCEESMDAISISVGEDFYCGGDIEESFCDYIIVAGDFECVGDICVSSIIVYGKLRLQGSIETSKVDVG